MNPIRTPAAFAAAVFLAMNAVAHEAPLPPAPDADPGPGARALRGPRPGDDPRLAGPETTVGGRVARWLVNPNGDVDGLLLEDGTQVEVAPHLSAQLTDAIKTKDAVEITGRRGEAAKVVRASTIVNTRSGRSVGIESRGPDAAPPLPRPAGALTAMNASGRIDVLLYTARGDINGALLQDGTVVRFPPRAADQAPGTLKPGAVIYARGYGTRNAQGSALEATALGANAETAREVFAGPGPDGARRGADAMPPQPVGGAPTRRMPPPRPPADERGAPDAPRAPQVPAPNMP